MAITLGNMAAHLVMLGRYDEARVRATEALDLACGLRMVGVAARALQNLTLAAVLRPQVAGRLTSVVYAGAARLFGFIGASRKTLGQDFGMQLEYDRALVLLRDAIGAEEVARLTAAGATMTEDEAIAQAQALE